MTELTFAILKYGFLILLWGFVWLLVHSLYLDVASFAPRKTRAHRRRERLAQRPVHSPARSTLALPPTGEMPSEGTDQPTLLTIIDGPLAGTSVPLTDETITLGRSATNTLVLDDEFVSSHHARIYKDPRTRRWTIEDLDSTNGTVVNQQRISAPTLLAARTPVRIGATTFELR